MVLPRPPVDCAARLAHGHRCARHGGRQPVHAPDGPSDPSLSTHQARTHPARLAYLLALGELHLYAVLDAHADQVDHGDRDHAALVLVPLGPPRADAGLSANRRP
eukprot:6565584-Prymnesium_polylepis.1